MSLSHHGDGPEQLANLQRLVAQIEGTARRSYPAGRMGANDDGALSYAVANDPDNETVIIRFGTPVEWIGLAPKDAIALAERLVAGARSVSREPVVVRFSMPAPQPPAGERRK